MPVGGRNNAPR